MRYSFGDYILDTKLEMLLANKKRLDLEPKQYSTLLLLCKHKNEIVSREQLLEAIWNGIIVSENTINKHIAGLRKLLDDNAKSPKYIETVPRKGYRFIGNPVLLIEQENELTSSLTKSNSLSLKLVAAVACIMIATTMLWRHQESPKTEDIQTLTRMEGDKRSISFYKDKLTIAFINQRKHSSELMIQAIEDQGNQKVRHEFEYISHVLGAAGEEQLYLVGRRMGKKWLVRGKILDNAYVVESQLDISGFRIFDIDYVSNSSSLYLVAQSFSTRDRGLYHVDKGFKNIEPLYVPENEDILFTRVDSDSNKEALLILGQLPGSHSTVFSFNPKNNEIQQLHKFDSLIRDVIWHNKGILYTDTPPAQRILQLQLNTAIEPDTIATSSEYLCCEMLYSELTEQLIYRTNTTNFHIDWVGESRWVIDNSTVYDMLPSLFHKSDGVVFVSKRSGKSQIYRQKPNSTVEQLSNFSRYHVVRALDVSSNDKQVIAVVDNQLLLFSAESQTTPTRKKFNNKSWLQDVRWLDEKHFVVSHRNKFSSWLEVYDLEFNSIQSFPSKWRQIFTDQQDPKAWFALHESLGLVQLEPVVFNNNVELKVESQLNRTIQTNGKILKDGQFFYQQQSNREEITQFDDSGKLFKTHQFQRAYGFDVYQSKIIVSDLKYQSSDLHTKALIP